MKLRLRVRLKTVLWGMLPIALGLGYIGDAHRTAKMQDSAMAVIHAHGGKATMLGTDGMQSPGDDWLVARRRTFQVELPEETDEVGLGECLRAVADLNVTYLETDCRAWESERFALFAAQAAKIDFVSLTWGKLTADVAANLRRGAAIESLNFSELDVDERAMWEACAALPRLKSLTLQKMKCDGVELAALKQSRSLEELDFRKTILSPAGWKAVGELTELQRLKVFESDLSDELLAHFSGCKNLVELVLAENPLRGKGLASLSALNELERLMIDPGTYALLLDEFIITHDGSLDVRHSDEKEFSLRHLPSLPKLKELELPNARLREEEWGSLLRFPALRRLDCSFSNCPPQTMKQLCEGRPELEITTPFMVATGTTVAWRHPLMSDPDDITCGFGRRGEPVAPWAEASER